MRKVSEPIGTSKINRQMGDEEDGCLRPGSRMPVQLRAFSGLPEAPSGHLEPPDSIVAQDEAAASWRSRG